MKTFSLIRTIFWIVLTPVAYVLGWLALVEFVSLLSIWALVETAFAAWRSDVNPDQDRILALLEEMRDGSSES